MINTKSNWNTCKKIQSNSSAINSNRNININSMNSINLNANINSK